MITQSSSLPTLQVEFKKSDDGLINMLTRKGESSFGTSTSLYAILFWNSLEFCKVLVILTREVLLVAHLKMEWSAFEYHSKKWYRRQWV